MPAPDRATRPIERLVAQFEASLRDDTFVRVVLSPGPTGEGRVSGRLVQLADAHVLGLSTQTGRQDVTRNLPVAEAGDWLRGQLAAAPRAVLVETTRRNWQLQPAREGSLRLVSHPPRHATPPSREHDRAKPSVLTDAADWLHALGLTDRQGQPFPSRADKCRQIARYAEILGHCAAESAWRPDRKVRVADLGCGRGYLTCAVWQLFRRHLHLDVEIVGVDVRTDLTTAGQAMAERLNLTGLSFRTGTIADTPLGGLDIVIALHACNTATDDALRRGIQSGCPLLLVAPCCHQELRPQLDPVEPFAGPAAHGLLAERLAEWLTDALRTLHLEAAGYRVKAVEFVGSEHTPKNLLLVARRTGDATTAAAQAARTRIHELRRLFGIQRQALDVLLA